MNKLKYVLWAACGICLFTGPPAAEGQDVAGPNIVVMISDDHGAGHGGYDGNPDVRTPHLDKLAGQGMRFKAAFAADTLCSPSRAVMHTGLMPFRNGGHVFGGHVRKGVKTFSHYLGPLGYQTVLLGKTSLHPSSAFPYDVKRAKWEPGAGEIESIPAMVEDFLSSRKSDKPLYLEVNTGVPHMPWLESTDYEPSELMVPDRWPDTPGIRDALADYYTSVTAVDTIVGEVRRILGEHGFNEDTLFIYTSDHGSNFHLAKWCLYDAGIQVPFIARWPGHIEPGTSTDAMVSLADLLPTIVEAAGGDPPTDIDGRSFLKVLTGHEPQHRKYVFASHTGMSRNYPSWKANHSPHRAVRTPRYKYILNLNPNERFITHLSEAGPGRQANATHPYWKEWVTLAENGNEKVQRIIGRYHWRPIEELYDLQNDPHEQHNLASDSDHAQTLRQLRERLGEWRKKQNDHVPVFLTKSYVAPNR